MCCQFSQTVLYFIPSCFLILVQFILQLLLSLKYELSLVGSEHKTFLPGVMTWSSNASTEPGAVEFTARLWLSLGNNNTSTLSVFLLRSVQEEPIWTSVFSSHLHQSIPCSSLCSDSFTYLFSFGFQRQGFSV